MLVVHTAHIYMSVQAWDLHSGLAKLDACADVGKAKSKV